MISNQYLEKSVRFNLVGLFLLFAFKKRQKPKSGAVARSTNIWFWMRNKFCYSFKYKNSDTFSSVVRTIVIKLSNIQEKIMLSFILSTNFNYRTRYLVGFKSAIKKTFRRSIQIHCNICSMVFSDIGHFEYLITT